MDRCPGKLKRPACADREDERIPAVGFVRSPHVEHALSAAHRKVPRHEMDQSGTAVSGPKFCEMLFYQHCHLSLPSSFGQLLPTCTLFNSCEPQSADEACFPTAPPQVV